MGSSLTACLICEDFGFIMIPACPNLKSVMGGQTDERNSVLLFINSIFLRNGTVRIRGP